MKSVNCDARKVTMPTTIGQVDDYNFVVDTEQPGEPSNSWSLGVPFGVVETVHNDPDVLVHHSNGMALVKQVDEMRATEQDSCCKCSEN